MLEEPITSIAPALERSEDIAARLAHARPRLLLLARLRGVPASQAEDTLRAIATA